MTLDDWKLLSEIVSNACIAVGMVLGGFWTYYKFVRGRLFSPKIELSLLSTTTSGAYAVKRFGCELSIKNIGSTRLHPSRCSVLATAHSASADASSEDIEVFESADVLPFPRGSAGGLYYIDPGEASFRSITFPVAGVADMLSVRVEVDYNASRRTVRTFLVGLNEADGHSEKASSIRAFQADRPSAGVRP